MSYTRTQFIAKIAPYAIADSKTSGIPASLTIAQGALESANGNSGLTTKANNLFGIKGSGTAGSVTMSTTEYVNGKAIKVNAAFRAYKNWGESVADHSKLILNGVSWNRSLYSKVVNTDGKTAAYEIQKAGYATDPNYAKLLIGIMDTYNLYQYDNVADFGGVHPDRHQKEVEDMEKVKHILTKDNSVHNGFIKDNENFVPVSVLKALGHKVSWDNVNKKLYIS